MEGLKWHFSIFCWRRQNQDLGIRFLALFEPKMTKIDILKPKLIIPDEYQQFWVHFDWFLALFSYCFSSSKKYTKKVLFGLKTHFKKFS